VLVTADAILAELEEKLHASRIVRRYHLTEEQIAAVLRLLRSEAELVPVAPGAVGSGQVASGGKHASRVCRWYVVTAIGNPRLPHGTVANSTAKGWTYTVSSRIGNSGRSCGWSGNCATHR
jgi:hypothetical protein